MILPYCPQDRRRHPRAAVHRPVKLRHGVTGKFISGYSIDLSDGGCLLRLDGGQRLSPGQSVRVGVADYPNQALILADDMLEGTVLRRLGHGDSQHVAIAYAHVDSLAAAV